MSSPTQTAFYHSAEWLKCRAAYIKSVGGLCERCADRGAIVPGYIVHHREWITEQNITDPNVLLSFDNLEYLCLDCHNRVHGKEKIKRYEVGSDGKIIIKA